MHGSPFLELLQVHGSQVLTSLHVSALKNLEMTFRFHLETLTFCDTNLISLKITKAETLVLANVPMLVDVLVSGRSNYLVKDFISWLSCCPMALEVLVSQKSSVKL